MAERTHLRASDADRERVAERLRQATTEGRLRPDEFEHRLGAAFSATTYGELDALLADLPGPHLARRSPTSALPWLRPALALAIAIPLALLVLAAVAFVLTGLFAVCTLWLFLGWWFFAGRRRALVSRSADWRPQGPRRRAPARPDLWL